MNTANNNRRQAPKQGAAKARPAKQPARGMQPKAAAGSVSGTERVEAPKILAWFKADTLGVSTFRSFEVEVTTNVVPDIGFTWRKVNMVNMTLNELKGAIFFNSKGEQVSQPIAVLSDANKNVVSFKQQLPEQIVKGMERDFPKYKVVTGKGSHSHGSLAATRKFYETVIYNQLSNQYGGTIIDVGGSVRRHSGRRVHSLNPVMIESDLKRNEDAQDILNRPNQTVTMCNHKWLECNCLVNYGAPVMSVHSLYYMGDGIDQTFYAGPSYVHKCMTKFNSRVLVALHHALDSVYYEYNGIHKEGSYYRNGCITMSVTDNPTAYQHGTLDWLMLKHYRPIGIGMKTLVWETKSLSCFDLRITTFRLLDELPERVPQTDLLTFNEVARWEGNGSIVNSVSPVKQAIMRIIENSALQRPTWTAYFYQLIGPLISCVANQLRFEFGMPIKIMKYGNLVIFGENTTAVIDVGLHHYLMGKVTIVTKIDQQVLDNLFALARQYNKYHCIPSFNSNRAIYNTVSYTISRLLNEGTKFYQEVQERADEINQFNQLAANSFNPVEKQTQVPYVTYALIGCGLLYAGYKLRSAIKPLLMTVDPKQVKWQHAALAIGIAFYNRELIQGGFLEEGEVTQAVCTRGAPVPEIGRDHKNNLLHDVDYHDEGFCRPRFGNFKMVGLHNRHSYICSPCVHNLYVGASTRLLHRSDLQPPEWLNGCDEEMFKLLWGDNLLPTKFEQWVSRFPGPRKRMLTKANDSLMGGSILLDFDPKVREWFIKKENYIKGNDVGYEVIKPRIISGPNIYYLVQTGPISHAIGVRAKMVWNGVNSNVLYTSGYSANQLGHLFDIHVENLGGKENVIIIEGDASSFESSVKINQYKFVHDLVRKMGVEEELVNLLEFQSQRCRFKTMDEYGNELSVKFSAIRHSGDGMTSFGNSAINLKSLSIVFGTVLEKCRIWVLGDDNMIIMPKNLFEYDFDVLNGKFKDIGFEMKLVKSTVYTASFCSGLFYPTTEGTIWGPKISRVMAKTFTCHHNYLQLGQAYYLQWIRQVAVGLQLDVQFIPGLRVIVKKLLQIPDNNLKLPRQFLIDFERDHKLHNKIQANLNLETYDMLFENYGLTKFEFDSLENYLESTKLGPNLKHFAFDVIVDKDIPITPVFEGKPSDYLIMTFMQALTLFTSKSKTVCEWFATALFDINGNLIEITPKQEILNNISVAPVVAYNYWIYSVAVAPMYEEGMKEILIQSGWSEFNAAVGFATYEVYTKYVAIGGLLGLKVNPQVMVGMSAAWLAHVFLFRGSYKSRVQKHTFWNFCLAAPVLLSWAFAEFCL